MNDDTPYIPPAVWTWEAPSGGKFSSINRPISGATHEADLPVGGHPLQLYSLATPNGVKVTILPPDVALAGLILPTLVTNIWQAFRQGDMVESW